MNASGEQHMLCHVADDVLTFIEQREAEQIAYGIYDVIMTGAEVIAGFRPHSLRFDTDAERYEQVCSALQLLYERLDVLRLDDDPAASVEMWVLRSRIAEMVRLIALVRQRIVWFSNQRESHRLSSSKRLVTDVTLTVQSRLVPRRDRPSAEILATTLRASEDHQRVAAYLTEVIDRSLPKLRLLSGFQQRAFEAILRAIDSGERGGGSRGVAVTAGTGAGKTYAFFLPVLVYSLLARCLRGQVGVKAICIYPRVALSENQLSDFIEILFHVNRRLAVAGLPALTIGIESGATMYTIDDLRTAFASPDHRQKLAAMRGWTYAEELRAFQAPFAECVGSEEHRCAESDTRLVIYEDDPLTLACPQCGARYPFIKYIREGVMDRNPPDILVATTESLNRRLLSSRYQYLFGNDDVCAPTVVMLDEIHLQASTAGAQTALLLRRLIARIREGKLARGDHDRVVFVGLSATIAQPVQFVSDLTGINPEHVTEICPDEEEMQAIGAERFIFVRATENEDVATISTLIQTTMAALHTMPQPDPESGIKRYRAFGFVQSLDIVGRWRYQMEDAERMQPWHRQRREEYKRNSVPVCKWDIGCIPLYVYRYPPYNRQLFPRLLGSYSMAECSCEHRHGPNLACPLFQAGECWWVLSQKHHARREPLNIRRKSAADRDQPIHPDDDLIITTSALEVGYDDDTVMCVIQYGAPANIASFVQRKGRGGRRVGARPIVITVLSPYSSAELFLYRNQHLLTDPTFRKLPLNTQNRFLQRIHGLYAVIDWMAYQAHRQGVELDFEGLNASSLAFLQEQGADPAALLAIKDYIRRAFSIDGAAAAELIAGREGVMLNHYLTLIRRVARTLIEQETLRYGVNGRETLHDRLPENLFSDINLPEVRVHYGQTHKNNSVTESISLALTTTAPGNVSFRGGYGAAWIPPIVSETEVPRIRVTSDVYEGDFIEDKVRVTALPERALRMTGIDPDQTQSLRIFRPTRISLQLFSRDHQSSFWYCNPDDGAIRHHQEYSDAGQHELRLSHASVGFPITAVEIRAESEDLSPDFRLLPDHPSIRADALGVGLARQILLYSDEPANRHPLDVHVLMLGSRYSLVFHEHRADPIEGVVGFTHYEENEPCALGYQMHTDGLALDLADPGLERLRLPESVAAQLRYAAVRHAFMTELMVERGINMFAAGYLADALLMIADEQRVAHGVTLDALATWWQSGEAPRAAIKTAVCDIFHLSKRKAEATLSLSDDPATLALFARIYAEIMAGGAGFWRHLRDTFKYSVAQALKQTAQEIAGVEALRYIGAYTRLHADFGERATDRVWLYEIGMGGIGVMRATHEAIRREPDRFWTVMSQRMTRCPTAREEALLRLILSQPGNWLDSCNILAQQIRTERTAGARQRAIEDLLAQVRKQLGIVVRQDHLKALLRLFIPDYLDQSGETPISNWRLFYEINTIFVPDFVRRFGREPTFAEVRGLLYREVSGQGGESYPTLARLLALYRDEHGPQSPEAAREAFESAIDRRLLRSCWCACPSCLDDRGGQEGPGLSWMLLSRPLLAVWLDHVRASSTLHLDADSDPSLLRERLRVIFEQGVRSLCLRAPVGTIEHLCRAVSYLTDAGIDTNLGMMYPMITDIATLFPEDREASLMVELTIRPIE
ncbi:MAG: DEAD/DEAH box helicase [Roseiflexus sp.]|nr:DEAD/DEAH box helicase [Roseiflexus sp.]